MERKDKQSEDIIQAFCKRQRGHLGAAAGAKYVGEAGRLKRAHGSRLKPIPGTLADTNLVFSGDIGDRKLAWLLPDDYYPPPPEED